MKNVRATSEYTDFPFENATLMDLWEKATYKNDEVLVLAALNSIQTSKFIL